MEKRNDKMSQTKSGFDEKMVRNATWGASLLTAAGLLFVVVGIFIAEINSWKDYVLLGAPAVLFLLGLVSIALLRRGEIVRGSGLILTGMRSEGISGGLRGSISGPSAIPTTRAPPLGNSLGN